MGDGTDGQCTCIVMTWPEFIWRGYPSLIRANNPMHMSHMTTTMTFPRFVLDKKPSPYTYIGVCAVEGGATMSAVAKTAR